jgi:hypothetical protein
MTGTLTAPPVDPGIAPWPFWVLGAIGLLAAVGFGVWSARSINDMSTSPSSFTLKILGFVAGLFLIAGAAVGGAGAAQRAAAETPERKAWNSDAAAWMKETYDVVAGAEEVAASYPAEQNISIVAGDDIAAGYLTFIQGRPFLVQWKPFEGAVQLPRAEP